MARKGCLESGTIPTMPRVGQQYRGTQPGVNMGQPSYPHSACVNVDENGAVQPFQKNYLLFN